MGPRQRAMHKILHPLIGTHNIDIALHNGIPKPGSTRRTREGPCDEKERFAAAWLSYHGTRVGFVGVKDLVD
ncbi:hypothetical protein KSC_104270 [Ktedonobacter sp. SOSP1-52]|nr:hypothetical protein [Ktedonobacter sp. SOSP1-52]GHO71535.1 hypothetical protein KSC_104270 [Ktedonobacter sp. SOSP1-52]